jgi:hypothetical protein
MNNLENNVKNVIEQQLNNGLVEKLVAENLEKGINKALEDLFCSYGDITSLIKGKIKSVLIGQLEKYDYSEYVVKLDHVLGEILKNTTLDNRKILGNFKDLMSEDLPKKIKITDIVDKYRDYVSKNIDTSSLEVCEDDGPSYHDANVSFEIEEIEARSYSYFTRASMFLECDEDESLNIEISLSKHKSDDYWTISYDKTCEIQSLRRLNEFQIYLLKITKNLSEVEIDKWEGREEVEIEEEPTDDVTYS